MPVPEHLYWLFIGSEDVYHSKWFGYIYFDFLTDKDNLNDNLDTMLIQVIIGISLPIKIILFFIHY